MVKSAQMTAKDTRLTLRVRSELKQDLEAVAIKESGVLHRFARRSCERECLLIRKRGANMFIASCLIGKTRINLQRLPLR